MAKVEHPVFAALRGKFGDDMIFKKRGEKVFMCRFPSNDGKLSPKQMTNAELMWDASQYASFVCLDLSRKIEAQIRLKVPFNKVFHALVSEYYKLHKEERMANSDVRNHHWDDDRFKTEYKKKRLTERERHEHFQRYLENQKKASDATLQADGEETRNDEIKNS